jgi:WD40 repeat protein
MYWKLTFLFFFIANTVFTQIQEIQPVFQTGHYSRINKIEFHSENNTLVSCADDGKLIIWDIYLGLQYGSVLVDQSGIRTFEFLNNTSIVTLSNKGAIQTWSFPDLTPLAPSIIPVDNLQDIVVLNDTMICAVGHKIYLYNHNTQTTQTLDYESKGLFSTVDYNPVENAIAIASPTDNYCTIISLDNPYLFQHYILGHMHQVKYGSNKALLMSEKDGSLITYNKNQNKKRIFNLKDNHNFVTDVDASRGHLALSTNYGFAKILLEKDQTVITTIGLDGIALSALDYSQDKKWLAIGNNNGTITLYETENYKLNRILKGASASVTDVQFYEDDLFIGYSDGVLRKINLPENKIISNSIKPDAFEQKSGIKYTILSIDTLLDNQLQFTVLKTDRHHEKVSLLRSAKKYSAVWNLSNNEIILKKEIDDIKLRLQVDQYFRSETPFQLEQYVQKPNTYQFNGNNYVTDPAKLTFKQIKESKTYQYPTWHQAPISGIRFSQNHALIVTFSSDGSIRFWDTEGNYIAALYLSGQYEYTYWRPNNYYFSSKEMLNKIGFIYNGKLFSYEQFDLYYNRPNEVMKHLPYFTQEDVQDYQKAYLKRLEKLNISNQTLKISEELPEIEITYSGEYSTKKAFIDCEIELTGKHDIIDYSYRINGNENTFKLEEPAQTHHAKLTIALAAGLNQIEFYCRDEKNVKSLLKKINITCERKVEKPDLYLVSIGVSKYEQEEHNLVFAEKDAREFAQLMQKNKKFNSIHDLTLLDTDFKQGQFPTVESFLAQAKINDVILFYYAGHGVLDENLDYFLATHDMNFSHPKEKGILFDAIEIYFESLVCRNKLMMIDACFSGAIDKTIITNDTLSNESENGDIRFRSTTKSALDGGGEMGIFELAKMTFTDLDRNRGTNILSSASGIEYAMESETWKNGLFTFVLKDGLLNKKADLNGDNLIRIMELQFYLRETVSSLSNGQQNPILRKENNKNNFVIW